MQRTLKEPSLHSHSKLRKKVGETFHCDLIMASLVGSIFGEKEDKSGGLTSLFDESKELPEKPQHKARPKKRKAEASSEEQLQRHDDDVASGGKKKKRKQRKEKQETGSEAVEEKAASVASDEAKKDDADDVEERTIFVGNLPLDTTRKSLASMFKPCGKVESCRLRSVAASGVKLPTERAGDQVCCLFRSSQAALRPLLCSNLKN